MFYVTDPPEERRETTVLCTQSAPVRHAGVRQEAGGGEAAAQAAAVGAEPPDEAEHLVAVHLQHAHRPPHLHTRV